MGNEKNIDDFLSSFDEEMDGYSQGDKQNEGDDDIFKPEDQNSPVLDDSNENDDAHSGDDSFDQKSETETRDQTYQDKDQYDTPADEDIASDESESGGFSVDSGIISMQEDSANYTVKGTKTWNTREPYILNIDIVKLTKDIQRIQSSFCFLTEPILNDNEFKRYLNREMIKYRTQGDQSIIDRYTNFLHSAITLEIQSVVDFFKPEEEDGRLFIYHLGPSTVHRMITAKFTSINYGFCCMMAEEKKTIKFLPDEFIKDRVMNWFEENINTFDLPFDGIKQYDNVRNHVSKYYNSVLTIFNQRFEEINTKASPGKSISKNDLLRIKGDKWFGRSNILVYKRFILKTIFQ